MQVLMLMLMLMLMQMHAASCLRGTGGARAAVGKSTAQQQKRPVARAACRCVLAKLASQQLEEATLSLSLEHCSPIRLRLARHEALEIELEGAEQCGGSSAPEDLGQS